MPFADSASLWGFHAGDNQFFAFQVGLVWEDWKIIQGNNFHFEQWIFILKMDGALQKYKHGYAEEDSRGRLLSDSRGRWRTGELPASMADIEAKLKALLAFWYQFNPWRDHAVRRTLGSHGGGLAGKP